MDGDIVYSTAHKGPPPCPKCGKLPCACPKTPPPPMKQDEPVIVGIERGGRQGKTVTVVDRLKMHPEGKLQLLAKLKKLCGAGGTLKEGKLEIQGDQREKIKRALEPLGYRVKLSGG
jgi:translation initiation factor 1